MRPRIGSGGRLVGLVLPDDHDLPQVLLQIPPTNSVSGMLDAILVARFPDPIERAEAGAGPDRPAGIAGGASAGRIHLQPERQHPDRRQRQLGSDRRAQHAGAEPLLSEDEHCCPIHACRRRFLVFNNNIQQGAGITLSHTLTPVISLNGTLSDHLYARFRPERGREHAPGPGEPAGQLAVVAAQHGVRRHALPVPEARQRSAVRHESSEFAVFTGLFHRL